MSEIYWLNPVSGGFTNGSYWSGGVAPGAADDAIIAPTRTAPFTVTASASATVHSIQMGANATLAITSGVFSASDASGGGADAGIILVGAGAAFMAEGTLNNRGTIAIGGSAKGASLTTSGTLTLKGGGDVVLGDSAGNRIEAANGTTHAVIYNINNTISGAGVIGGEDCAVVNGAAGVIDATEVAPLTISDVGVSLINQGTLEATGRGGLTIYQRFVQNSGGVIFARNGSIVRLEDVAIDNGTIKSSGSGVVATSSVEWGAVNDANVEVSSSSTIYAESYVLVNHNSFDLESGPGAAEIAFGFYLTLTGGGTVDLGTSGANFIHGLSVLTNDDNTISGSGLIAIGQSGAIGPLDLINKSRGVIDADGSGVLTIDNSSKVVNAGLIEATQNGTLRILNQVQNSGTNAADGGTVEITGAIAGSGSAIVNGGTLEVFFSLDENVDFTGATGRLQLAQSASYDRKIIGFSATGGTSLDLTDIGFVSASEATFAGTSTRGLLTVGDGTHTARIRLVGDYLGATFVASSDGDGGVIVSAQAGETPASRTQTFVTAMAAFGAPSGHALHAGEATGGLVVMLARPRVSTA